MHDYLLNHDHHSRHWLKASISLTVVMGLTWIIGVLVIEVDELFALAFIFIIFVAFQGLFIFVIFVLFTEQVRETYTKWWKTKVSIKSDFLSKHSGEKSSTLGTTVLVSIAKSCCSITYTSIANVYLNLISFLYSPVDCSEQCIIATIWQNLCSIIWQRI